MARQAQERRRAFRRTVKWRTGSEARISALKSRPAFSFEAESIERGFSILPAGVE
jgi:hypothetical protein